MTCQCTCGKHMLIDISNSVMVPIQNNTGAVAYPVAIRQDASAWAPQFVDVVPNTAGAGPTMPNCASVRIEP